MYNDITRLVKEHNRGFLSATFGQSQSERLINEKALLEKVTKAAIKFAPEFYEKSITDSKKCEFEDLKRMLSQKALEQMTGDSVIDRISRIVFPIAFLMFNMFYAFYYLTARSKSVEARACSGS